MNPEEKKCVIIAVETWCYVLGCRTVSVVAKGMQE